MTNDGKTSVTTPTASQKHVCDEQPRVKGIATVSSSVAIARTGKVTGHGGAIAEVKANASTGDASS